MKFRNVLYAPLDEALKVVLRKQADLRVPHLDIIEGYALHPWSSIRSITTSVTGHTILICHEIEETSII